MSAKKKGKKKMKPDIKESQTKAAAMANATQGRATVFDKKSPKKYSRNKFKKETDDIIHEND